MTSNPNQQPNAEKPNMDKAKLFNELAHKMMQYALKLGHGFPAIEYTEEEIEMFAPYESGGMLNRYNTSPYNKDYAKKMGIVDDSKTVLGLLDMPIDGMREIYLHVLGEGPSIYYGEFGRVSLLDEEGIKLRKYVLNNDGTVMVSTGIDDIEAQCMEFDEPREATTEELSELTTSLETLHVIPLHPHDTTLIG
jgi:hypothetical protein